MNSDYKEKLSEVLKSEGITLLAYCDINSRAAEPLWDDKGVFSPGHMLVQKDDKLGILYDLGNLKYEIYIPVKYDAIFNIEGYEVSDFTDFFNGYSYFCLYGIKISDKLYVFDSYEDNHLKLSFVASNFDKECYHRDGHDFLIYPNSLHRSTIQPFDIIKRVTCERNSWAQECYGNDNCYLAVKNEKGWTLYEDFSNKPPKIFLKDFHCDDIIHFGYFCFGRYVIVKHQLKQSLILLSNNTVNELNFQVDYIFQIGWCDLDNLYHPEICDEHSAFILKCDNKFAILNPTGDKMSQFIFDSVLGFINRDTIQVMQYNGQHKLYGEYQLSTGTLTPCIFTSPHSNLQK